jgi:endonuclease YncB( thermonuclease family)
MGINKKLAAAAAAAVITGTTAVTLPYYLGEKVIRVYDGDTFQLENLQSVRLYDTYAPEMGRCYSDEAKTALNKLVLNKRVVLRNPLSDRFGRIMAMVYVNGISVNVYMVKNGYATGDARAGAEASEMKNARQYAQMNKLGIYSDKCTQLKPPNPKCNIKGNVDTSNPGRVVYTLPGCPGYQAIKVLLYEGDQWFCSEAEAKKAGFVKADSCK